MRRRTPLVLLALALVALVAAAVARGDQPRPAFGRTVVAGQPVADMSPLLSSTWYCAAGTALSGGGANLTVVVANPDTVPRRGVVVWVPSGPDSTGPVRRTFDVPALGSTALQAVEALTAPGVSAIVEMVGGGVAVEHVVNGPRGSAAAPCASEASREWYFAAGVTERDAGQVLVLFNPFPDDAVVDIEFATDTGRDAPPALTGLPLPPGTTTTIDLASAVRRRAVTATAVRARTGRLVVDRLQSFDGTAGRTGVSLALASPVAAETWWFPDGLVGEGVAEQWHVFNPGEREAQVSLEIVPASGPAPEPVDLTIPARSQVTVDAASVGSGVTEVVHNTTVRSLNGVGVVAERVVDARAPSVRRGWSSALGSTIAARRWLFAVGEASGTTDEWVVVQNPGTRVVSFSVVALVGGRRLPIEDLVDLEVPVAGRLAVRLGDHIQRGRLALLVEATGDVVVERDLYGVGRPLVSTVVGIPLVGD